MWPWMDAWTHGLAGKKPGGVHTDRLASLLYMGGVLSPCGLWVSRAWWVERPPHAQRPALVTGKTAPICSHNGLSVKHKSELQPPTPPTASQPDTQTHTLMLWLLSLPLQPFYATVLALIQARLLPLLRQHRRLSTAYWLLVWAPYTHPHRHTDRQTDRSCLTLQDE